MLILGFTAGVVLAVLVLCYGRLALELIILAASAILGVWGLVWSLRWVAHNLTMTEVQIYSACIAAVLLLGGWLYAMTSRPRGP